MHAPKPLAFCGSSQDDLRAFPPTAKREAGHQLDQVQNGFEADIDIASKRFKELNKELKHD